MTIEDLNVLSDMLALVGYNVSTATLSTWTEQECQEAMEWASLTHVHASDNPRVPVPARPMWLPEPWAAPGGYEIWDVPLTLVKPRIPI